MLDALDDRRSQFWVANEFAVSASPVLRFAVGRDTEIAGQVRHFSVLELVPRKLTENRRAMSAELLCNHVDGDTGMPPALDLSALIQIDLRVGAFHLWFLAGDKPLVSLQSRTSR
jgi:hypothetical protein